MTKAHIVDDGHICDLKHHRSFSAVWLAYAKEGPNRPMKPQRSFNSQTWLRIKIGHFLLMNAGVFWKKEKVSYSADFSTFRRNGEMLLLVFWFWLRIWNSPDVRAAPLITRYEASTSQSNFSFEEGSVWERAADPAPTSCFFPQLFFSIATISVSLSFAGIELSFNYWGRQL